MHNEIVFQTIGTIYSSYENSESTPIQPIFAEDSSGYVKLHPDFVEGIQDLEGFSHIYLIYYLHQAGAAQLKVKPYLQDVERGVFATRAPKRPNPIGMSIVKLDKIVGNIIHISGLDILNGTPLLDIKPYIKRFDLREDCRQGWLDTIDESEMQDRGRRINK